MLNLHGLYFAHMHKRISRDRTAAGKHEAPNAVQPE